MEEGTANNKGESQMKTLIAVSVLALCSAVAAQDAAYKPSFDADRSISSCKAAGKKYLSCFGAAHNYAKIVLDLQSGNLILMIQSRMPIDKKLSDIAADVESLKALNRAYVPLLREELSASPVALALLPKLHAAFDSTASSGTYEIGESKNTYYQRRAQNSAATLQLLKEVEFSQ